MKPIADDAWADLSQRSGDGILEGVPAGAGHQPPRLSCSLVKISAGDPVRLESFRLAEIRSGVRREAGAAASLCQRGRPWPG